MRIILVLKCQYASCNLELWKSAIYILYLTRESLHYIMQNMEAVEVQSILQMCVFHAQWKLISILNKEAAITLQKSQQRMFFIQQVPFVSFLHLSYFWQVLGIFFYHNGAWSLPRAWLIWHFFHSFSYSRANVIHVHNKIYIYYNIITSESIHAAHDLKRNKKCNKTWTFYSKNFRYNKILANNLCLHLRIDKKVNQSL